MGALGKTVTKWRKRLLRSVIYLAVGVVNPAGKTNVSERNVPFLLG